MANCQKCNKKKPWAEIWSKGKDIQETAKEMGIQELKCDCKCHFGGAVSCPGCKENHKTVDQCSHCK